MHDDAIALSLIGLIVVLSALCALRPCGRRRDDVIRMPPRVWRCFNCGAHVPPANVWAGTQRPVEHPPSCTRCRTNHFVYATPDHSTTPRERAEQ